MSGFPERTTLGRSGLRVSKLGLGSSFGAPRGVVASTGKRVQLRHFSDLR